MNASTVQPREALEKVFQDFLPVGTVSREKEAEMFDTLEEAIVLNMTTRLLNGLSGDAKTLLDEQNFESYAELMAFLQKVTPPDAFTHAAELSVTEIFTEFLSEIEA